MSETLIKMYKKEQRRLLNKQAKLKSTINSECPTAEYFRICDKIKDKTYTPEDLQRGVELEKHLVKLATKHRNSVEKASSELLSVEFALNDLAYVLWREGGPA